MKKTIAVILAVGLWTVPMNSKPSKKKLAAWLVPTVGLAIGGTVIGYNLSLGWKAAPVMILPPIPCGPTRAVPPSPPPCSAPKKK